MPGKRRSDRPGLLPVLDWDNWNGGGSNAEDEGWVQAAAYVDGNTLLLYASFMSQQDSNTVGGPIRLFTSADGESFTDQGIVVDNAASWLPGGGPEAEAFPAGAYEDENGTWHLWFPPGDNAGYKSWSLMHVSGSGRDSCGSGGWCASLSREVARIATPGMPSCLRVSPRGQRSALRSRRT